MPLSTCFSPLTPCEQSYKLLFTAALFQCFERKNPFFHSFKSIIHLLFTHSMLIFLSIFHFFNPRFFVIFQDKKDFFLERLNLKLLVDFIGSRVLRRETRKVFRECYFIILEFNNLAVWLILLATIPLVQLIDYFSFIIIYFFYNITRTCSLCQLLSVIVLLIFKWL